MEPAIGKSLSDWLYELENRYQQEINLGLERVHQVATLLGVLNSTATIITVAGTNGKGSTVAALEAIYCQAGYQVGAYTSPHLMQFNERIRVNQMPILDEELINAFSIVDAARQEIPLTYFEIATLAALWHFKQQKLAVIILEVGLGGRLDAVNCIDSDLAIITTIGYDHQAYLGNTLEEIGQEKAGIIRPLKPIIYADDAPPQSIIRQAHICRAPIFRKGIEYNYYIKQNKIIFSVDKQEISVPRTKFHPNSIAAALMATVCLEPKLAISKAASSLGLEKINLAGRLHIIKHPHLTILDVAHNPQAAQYLANYLLTHYAKTKIHIIFSAFSDKDLAGMVKPFKQCLTSWYPTLLPGKRAASAKQILEVLQANQFKPPLCYNSPLFAYQAACKQAKNCDLIVVFGSFVLVGAILSALTLKEE